MFRNDSVPRPAATAIGIATLSKLKSPVISQWYRCAAMAAACSIIASQKIRG